MVVNADEDDAVFAEEFSGEAEPRVHHVAPVGVVAAVGFGVGATCLAGLLFIVIQRIAEGIFVNEIVAGVVWRVDVDHLDLAVVRALEEFQYFEIVTFDVEVLSGIPVNALVFLRTQCSSRRSLRLANGVSFARPSERIAFLSIVYTVAEDLAKLVEVDFFRLP